MKPGFVEADMAVGADSEDLQIDCRRIALMARLHTIRKKGAE